MPPARRVTLQQVAAAAGVSSTTASFVLSGRKDGHRPGSDSTVERVEQAARELGYVPNAHARAMRLGRTDSIALALGDARDPWVGELAHVVSQHAASKGLSTLVLVDESWHSLLQGRPFDCSLITGVEYGQGRDHVRDLARQGQRMVVHSGQYEPEGFDVIRSTAEKAVGSAIRRLRSRHDRVHFFGLEERVPERPNRSRLGLFLDEVAAAGEDPTGRWRAAPPTMGEAQVEASAWLREAERPTAVITQTSYLAIALQAAALRVGISVPDELEIIALGDVPRTSTLLGEVSHYAPADTFTTMAEVLVQRAVTSPEELPWRLLVFDWEFHPGVTTRDQIVG